MIKLDTKELRQLQRDMERAGAKLNRAIKPIMNRAGGNIMRDARKRVRKSMGKTHKSSLRHYPASISYTTTVTGFRTVTDIGPEHLSRMQGALGRGVEFGSVNTEPIPHNIPALLAEAPNVRKFLADAAAKVLLR